MLRNYFKTAWRNLLRNKFFSVIKILGLSLGLTVCMLIFLYTKDEMSYDRFHTNEGRLYRLTQTVQGNDNPEYNMGITNSGIGEALAKEIPEIKAFTRINGGFVTIKKNSDAFTESSLMADNNFFTVFSFRLIHGNKITALQDPYSVVLSENMAKKYFGTVDAVGKIIQVKKKDEFENYTITAVAENPPQNSSIKADLFFPVKYGLESMGHPWFGGDVTTFLMLSPNANVQIVENKIQTLFNENTRDFVAQQQKEQGVTLKTRLYLQQLSDIHLSKKFGPSNGMSAEDTGNPVYSYILTCIAVFILVIACINFINLAVAQSLKRSKEVGIRKVAGGTRKQLIKQFLAESFVVSSIAFVFAIALTIAALPFFNELAHKRLSFSYLGDGYLYAGYFLLLLITSFSAGFYPSLVLSAFKPVKVLYSKQKLMGRNYLTKGLMVLQFALAAFLVIGAIAINSQMFFLQHKDLGYDSKNLVRIDLPFTGTEKQLAVLFKNELAGSPAVLYAAAAEHSGARSLGAPKAYANGKNIEITLKWIDDKYLSAFKIPVITGRNFSPDYPSDSSHSVIVNESFIKEAGWNQQEAIGKPVTSGEGGNRLGNIVGVIKDYHFKSLKEKIGAAVFKMEPSGNYAQVWVKIKPDNIQQALTLLQNTYKKLVPYFPYTYQFMDDINARNYETEAKWKQIINIASALFIFISCIGLLGLVILSIEQRTKEIGIRKVLGAAVSGIVMLITREFIMLISIAFVIALPVAYYFINKWLQDFAYRIDIGWWIFATAGLLVIVVALITISFQAIKAAIANPVKSLRSE